MGFVVASGVIYGGNLPDEPPILDYRFKAFLNDGKPVFVTDQIYSQGQDLLSVNDVQWASMIDQVTNDLYEDLIFGDWYDMKDVTWFECFYGDATDGSHDRFELITFDILEPDHEARRFGQRLTNPRRRPATLGEIEAHIGELWSDVRDKE